MTTAWHRRVSPGDDSGATLVFALVIVTVVALVVGAILGFSDTSLRATVALRTQATTAATADGAAQAAINTLRLGTYNNNPASPTYPKCFGSTATSDTLVLSNLVPGSTGGAANSAAVRCSPDPATGAAGGEVLINSDNKPGNALLTLSQNPNEHGLDVKENSLTIPFSVHGGILSNSDIDVEQGTLQSNSTVQANTGCPGPGTIIGVPMPVTCTGAGIAQDPAITKPGKYDPEATTLPHYQAVPANVAASCPGGVVTFRPGYYDDAQALSDLMSGNGPCAGSVWWFSPAADGTTGVYYFDFRNTAKSGGMANNHQWLIKDGQLIAGTPKTSTTIPATRPVRPVTVPEACKNPIHDETAVGVQFIFGGDSQLQVSGNADAEICASYHDDRPPLAVYGLKSGVGPGPVTVTGAAATTVTTDAAGGFSPSSGSLTSAAGAVDNVYEAYTAPAAGGTAHLTLSPYLAAPAIPVGASVSSATVRVVYGTSDAASNNNSRTVTVTPTYADGTAGAALPAQSITKNAQTNGNAQSVDITSDLNPVVKANGLSGLGVAYSTTMPGGKTDRLDAVLLDIKYTAPALRGETSAAVPGNCLQIPYVSGALGAGRCAVISTNPSYSGHFYIQGTTYTPLAPIDITLSNVTEQVLRFGVISRTLWLMETGSISYSGPVIEIPDNSPGFGVADTVVYLSVTVCPAASTCGYDPAKVSLRARVYLHDPTGTPVAGSRQIAVQSWAVQR